MRSSPSMLIASNVGTTLNHVPEPLPNWALAWVAGATSSPAA